jgi:uncharacterized membrane protein YcaP (DUF421 family)
MSEWYFDGWSGVVRVAVVGTAAYATLVVMLRVTGKRTLSKLNAFDLVVTVALGSTLSSVLLSSDVALAEGLVALGLLIALQWIVTWLSVRSRRVTRFVKAEPRLVYFDGQFIASAMKAERITEDELRAAAREQGVRSLQQVAAIVMETEGSVSVIRRDGNSWSALEGVQGLQERRDAR